MELQVFEKRVREEIERVIEQIITNNRKLRISAKARAGAEISDFLEEQFVKYTKNSNVLHNSEGAPKHQTQNPWDARTFVSLGNGQMEEIWIDFKAFKLTSKDSNPDIGTSNKIIKFINAGGFYLLYVHVFYQATPEGLEFVKNNGRLLKSYFLKDVSSSVHRTSTNQLQVNAWAEPVYRTREEFIELLVEKLKISYERGIQNIKKKLSALNKEELLKNNRISEEALKKQIRRL